MEWQGYLYEDLMAFSPKKFLRENLATDNATEEWKVLQEGLNSTPNQLVTLRQETHC
jgi:hypothetical protein